MVSRERGFTLAEFLVVVALLGVVALAGRPLLSSSLGEASLTAAVEEVVIALQHAQRAAASQGLVHRVTFDPGLDTIVVERASPDSAARSVLLDDLVSEIAEAPVESEPWEVVDQPGRPGREYRIDLRAARFRGVDLTVVDFATKNWLSFDDRGEPSSGGTVRVRLGGAGYRLSVDPVTGLVTRARLTPAEIQEVTP